MVNDVVLLRGAIKSQDERERAAGELCGVPYDLYGCDWPGAVANEVNRLKEQNKHLTERILLYRARLDLLGE